MTTLRKRNAEVAFLQGVDTKTSEKLVIPGRMLQMQNFEYTKSGEPSLRNGSTELGTTVYRTPIDIPIGGTDPTPYTGPVAQAEALATREDELLLFETDFLLTRQDKENQWVYKDRATAVTTKMAKVLDSTPENDEDHLAPQVATANGYRVYVWLENTAPGAANGALFYIIEDIVTGAKIVNRRELTSFTGVNTNAGFRVVAEGGTRFACVWVDVANLKGRVLDTGSGLGSPDPWGGTVTIQTNVNATVKWIDAAPVSSTEFFMAYVNTGNQIVLHRINNSTLGILATQALTDNASESLAVHVDQGVNGDLVCAWADDNVGTREVRSSAWNAALSLNVYGGTGGTLHESIASRTVDQMVVGEGVDTSRYAIVYTVGINTADYAVSSGAGGSTLPTTNHLITLEVRTQSVDKSAGTATADVGTIFNADVVSTPFVRGNHYFFCVVTRDLNDSVYGLMRVERTGTPTGNFTSNFPEIVGKMRQKLGTGFRRQSSPARVSDETTANRFIWGSSMQTNIRSVAGVSFQVQLEATALAVADFDDDANRHENIEKNGQLLMAGGTLQAYDGTQFVDQGWAWAPRIDSFVEDTGKVPAETRKFVCLFEWTDSLGNIHRSAPSNEVISVDGDDTSLHIFHVSTYTWHVRTTKLVFFATDAGGSVFHRIIQSTMGGSRGIEASSWGTHGAAASITLPAGWATGLTANEILYTDGGVLINDGAPSCTTLVEWNSRIVLGGLEEQNEIALSKIVFAEEGIHFNGNLRERVGSLLDPVTALAAMDEKLIIFKRRSIWVLFGEPPNDLGEGPTIRFQQLPFDSGCITPKSVAVLPQGVVFKDDDGLKLLTRALVVEPFGEPVDSFDSDAVTSAVLVPTKKQLRLTTDASTTLVYDYLHDAWHTFTNMFGTLHGAFVFWRGAYALASSAGVVRHEDSSFTDGASGFIPGLLETAWIKGVGSRLEGPVSTNMQTVKRIYRILLLGDRADAHNLMVEVGYDYDSAYDNRDRAIWKDGELLALDRYQLEIRPRLPKSQAFRLRIQNRTLPGSLVTESFKLQNIMMQLGVLPGLKRVHPTIGRR